MRFVNRFSIAGEIPDEGETEEPQIIRREDGSLLLDGMLATDDLKSVLNIAEFPDDENYHTLAGFMMARLGRIPVSGNHFEWEGLHFEVMDMDGKRVDKVMVRRVEVGSRQ